MKNFFKPNISTIIVGIMLLAGVSFAAPASVSDVVNVISVFNGELVGMSSSEHFTFEEYKAMDEVGGVIVYEVTAAQLNNAEKGYDLSIVDGAPVFTKGDRATAKELRKNDNFNEGVYKEIADLMGLQAAKRLVDAGAGADEDTAITALIATLK